MSLISEALIQIWAPSYYVCVCVWNVCGGFLHFSGKDSVTNFSPGSTTLLTSTLMDSLLFHNTASEHIWKEVRMGPEQRCSACCGHWHNHHSHQWLSLITLLFKNLKTITYNLSHDAAHIQWNITENNEPINMNDRFEDHHASPTSSTKLKLSKTCKQI